LGEVLPRRRDEVFLVTKTLANTATEVQSILEQSLRDLKTDAADLTFVHSVGSLDPEQILAPDGALAGLREAQKRGLTRFIGFTAHHKTSHAVRLLAEAELDAVMFAMNYVDRYTYNFQGQPLDLAREKGLGVVAMKVFGGAPDMKYEKPTRSLLAKSSADHQKAIDYALGLPGVTTAVVGMFSVSEVKENAGYARGHSAISSVDMDLIEKTGQQLAVEWKDHFGEAV
jgi:predicted aldo/keto reductase-like oxidoreductase